MSLHSHKKVVVKRDSKSKYKGKVLFVRETPITGSRVDCFDRDGNVVLFGFPTEFLN